MGLHIQHGRKATVLHLLILGFLGVLIDAATPNPTQSQNGPAPRRATRKIWKISGDGKIDPNPVLRQESGGEHENEPDSQSGLDDLQDRLDRLYQDKEYKKKRYKTTRSPDARRELEESQRIYREAEKSLESKRTKLDPEPSQRDINQVANLIRAYQPARRETEENLEIEEVVPKEVTRGKTSSMSELLAQAARADEPPGNDLAVRSSSSTFHHDTGTVKRSRDHTQIKKLQEEISLLKKSVDTAFNRGLNEGLSRRKNLDSEASEMAVSDDWEVSDTTSVRRLISGAWNSIDEVPRNTGTNPLLVNLAQEPETAVRVEEGPSRPLAPLPAGFQSSYPKQGYSLFFPSQALDSVKPTTGSDWSSLSLVRSGILPWNFSTHDTVSNVLDVSEIVDNSVRLEETDQSSKKVKRGGKSVQKRPFETGVDLGAVNQIFSHGSKSQQHGASDAIGKSDSLHKSKKTKVQDNASGLPLQTQGKKVVGGEAGRVGRCMLEFALGRGMFASKSRWKPREIMQMVKGDKDWERYCEGAGFQQSKLSDAMMGCMLSGLGLTRKSHNSGYAFDEDILAERLGTDLGSLQMKYILS